MNRLLKALFGVEILAFALWLGGLVAVAMMAPLIFQIVPSRDLAGRVFGAVLARFFPVMYVCGALILAAGAGRALLLRRVSRLDVARYGLVSLMLAIALYTGTAILGEMQAIQAALPGPIETLPLDAGPRARFDTLHKQSERLMGVVGLLGLVLLPLLIVRSAAGSSAGRAAPAAARLAPASDGVRR